MSALGRRTFLQDLHPPHRVELRAGLADLLVEQRLELRAEAGALCGEIEVDRQDPLVQRDVEQAGALGDQVDQPGITRAPLDQCLHRGPGDCSGRRVETVAHRLDEWASVVVAARVPDLHNPAPLGLRSAVGRLRRGRRFGGGRGGGSGFRRFGRPRWRRGRLRSARLDDLVSAAVARREEHHGDERDRGGGAHGVPP